MTFGSTFGRVFSPTFQPKSQAAAAASSWWLAGDINPANCIAAYQPKGAASYAASKVNLTGNTDYDATEGTAPDWDATNGWKGNGSNMYLKTGVIHSSNDMSLIMRMSNLSLANEKYLFSYDYVNSKHTRFGFSMANESGRYYCQYFNGNEKSFWDLQPQVMALAGFNCYADSVNKGTISDSGLHNNKELYILASNSSGSPDSFASIYIQAIAIYNAVLTSTQVGLLTTAMNAL